MKKTTKKIFLGLGLSFIGTIGLAQEGLEKIIVEKYYISTKADSIGSVGTLPAGSTTYRIYADMLPGYKFQALYGNSDHALKINSSTSFFNNEDRGATTANAIASAQLKNNTVALDSWFSVGASAGGQFGVLKSEDNDGKNLLTLNTLLKNNAAAMGIPLTTQDGNMIVTGKQPEAVAFVGIDPSNGIFDAASLQGNSFETNNGAISALNGATGPTAENRVLIGQFTTDGVFSFELNIQIGSPSGVAEKYVATNPINGEKTIPSLTFEANELPSVSITSPANNATFLTGAIATITASASDKDGTISQVEFFVDGTSVGIDKDAPYENKYTTTTGSHILTAVAKDNKGDSTISEGVNILVSDNIAPTVTISVTPTAFTGEMIPINAVATDPDGSIDFVEFFVDNISIGKDNSSPYSINWNTTLGTHTVKAVATDNKGLTGTSKDSTVIIKNNQIPQVTVSVPKNAITGDEVTIDATAIDLDGSISSVTFYVDGTPIGSDNTNPYNIKYKTTEGKHKIKAIATDNLGLSGTSKEDSILVVNNQFPTVSIQTPKNAITGDIVTFTANAEDKDGSVFQVEFFVNNVSVGVDITAPYSIQWPAIVGEHKVKAVATDDRGFKGNSADSTIKVVDNIAPTLELIVDSTAFVNTQITIAATANDPDGTIQKVEFYIDNTLIATKTSAPYTCTWNTTTGNHVVKAIVTDNRGLSTTKTKNIMVKENNASVNTLTESLQTIVYPNPASKELSVIASQNAKISLTDLTGKTVIEAIEISANTTHTMQIEHLTAGVYLVKIATSVSSKTERVIIQ